jgi:predicted transcriptional regulator
MKNKQWSFLTNYGIILAFIAQNPCSTTQHIAQMTNMSIRGVNIIIDNLTNAGYLTKVKEGRCNHYIVHPDRSVQEDLVGECTIGEVFKAFGYEVKKIENRDVSYA